MVGILAIRDRILSFSFRRRKDPFVEMLESAPLDDEPVTEDDLRSLEEGWQDSLAGRTISSEEVKRRYRERRAGKLVKVDAGSLAIPDLRAASGLWKATPTPHAES